jgi:hypothetical protein
LPTALPTPSTAAAEARVRLAKARLVSGQRLHPGHLSQNHPLRFSLFFLQTRFSPTKPIFREETSRERETHNHHHDTTTQLAHNIT